MILRRKKIEQYKYRKQFYSYTFRWQSHLKIDKSPFSWNKVASTKNKWNSKKDLISRSYHVGTVVLLLCSSSNMFGLSELPGSLSISIKMSRVRILKSANDAEWLKNTKWSLTELLISLNTFFVNGFTHCYIQLCHSFTIIWPISL